MALGTAPRRVSPGVWHTRKGRPLSAAGAAYWENKYAQGATDGQGHIIRSRSPRGPRLEAAPSESAYKKPSFDTVVRAKKGDRAAQQQVRAYVAHRRAKKVGQAQAEALTSAQFGGVEQIAARGYKTVNPTVGAVFKGLSPSTALQETGRALRRGNLPAAGLAAASIFPLGRGARLATGVERAIKAERAAARAETVAKAGLRGERALVAGEKAQQIIPARSRITRAVIEKPADVISQKVPKAPLVGERARVMKAAGRETRKEEHRGRTAVANQAVVLPKRGSDEDVAHFWFGHLPPAMRNEQGLATVRTGLQRELDRTLRREPLPLARKASKTLVAKQARVARLQKAFDRAVSRKQAKPSPVPQPRRLGEIDQEIARIKSDPGSFDLRYANAYTRQAARQLERLRNERTAVERPPLTPTSSPTVQRLGGALSVAKDELAAAEKIAGRPPKLGKVRTAGLPQQARNLAQQIAHLDRIIASKPTANPAVMETLGSFDKQLSQILREVGFLENVDTGARRAIVARWLGVKPSGQEIYIGHRLGKVRGSGGLRSMGFGKARPPQGATQRNRLILVRTGAVRPSTHVAAEDLLAAQTYRNALRARQDLWQAGEPFPGHLPDGYRLVNPEGQIVPATWKVDQLAQVADNPEQLAKKSHEMLQGFLGDKSNWQQIVDEARQTGKLDKLRIIPDRDVKRYYAQVLPAGPRTVGGRVYDKLIDGTAMSLIFARLGYVPKNVLQNLITAVPHQGVFLPFNSFRAAQLIPHPGQSELARKVWNTLVTEAGGGVSGSIAQEATSRILGGPARVVTAIADQPARVSALIHELAAEGVIPKLNFHLSDEDLRAILNVYEKNKPLANKVSQRAVDAMGDFDRMTPTQRRYMRRFFIVPGWLTAGTRYPIHFAVTHPLRSAALGYAAAGEPGAPERYQVNKPIDEYLMKGLPSYIQALPAEHWPSWLGGGPGKVERVQSLLPGAIPADVGLALSQGAPLPTAASYVNPMPEAIWNTAHSTYQTAAGETKKTTFLDALRSNFQRLAPGEAAVQQMLAPGSVPSKMYPDRSRLGALAKEAGVVPVRIDKQAAQQAQFRERGMTKALAVTKDQADFYTAIDQAGYEPDTKLKQAYSLRLELAKRLDTIHAHGLTYQQKAYRMAVRFAVERGYISKQEARDTLAAVPDATEAEIRKSLDWMRTEYFGGNEIRQAKQDLRTATGG